MAATRRTRQPPVSRPTGPLEPGPVRATALLATLPKPWDEPALTAVIARAVRSQKRKIVVLDDDPTGSQTMHDIDVLTAWDGERLQAAFAGPDPAFYILTNSRSLPAAETRALNAEIAASLAKAARETGVDFDLVSRSDSTLRGHYPLEMDVLQATLEQQAGLRFDGHILVPAFFEGGRITAGNIHWVAEGEMLIPAGQTPYARDPAFGYHASDLRDWIAEKSGGRTSPCDVLAISLEDVRRGGPDRVERMLLAGHTGQPVIVNCAGYPDLHVFVAGLLRAEAAGKRYLFRTAASFVKARSANPDRPMLTAGELGVRRGPGPGGLVVVGSYIGKSSEQLLALQSRAGVASVELNVDKVLSGQERSTEIARAAERLGRALIAGQTAVVFTSRDHVIGNSEEESLRIGQNVSAALVDVVRGVRITPRFVVAKGGITSSDIATKALEASQGRVLGQIMPGVSAWRLDVGSRYPGLLYVVFPGNVGGRSALADAVTVLNG
jgi:uncharacterized protein YgbK (DUF1537 family)